MKALTRRSIYDNRRLHNACEIKMKEHDELLENRKKFLDEIISVCKKHNLILAHEDDQGSFIIEEYSDAVQKWIMESLDYGL